MNTNKITIDVQFHQPKAFRFFWLKYVNGFKPEHHCAKCLIGPYSKHFPFGVPRVERVQADLDEAVSPYIYVCGVTSRYAWNVHCCGKPEPGATAEYQDERVSIVIHGLAPIKILPPDNPPALPDEFLTCRNWQFGYQQFPGVALQQSLLTMPEPRPATVRKSSRRAKGD
jgi:hypothetical protein